MIKRRNGTKNTFMSKRKRWTPGLGFLCVLSLFLAGCATKPIPKPTAQTSPLTGRLSTGTVASVRTVDPSAGKAGIAAVLAALDQTGTTPTHPATEIVIRRPDKSAAAMVVPSAQAGSANFRAGEPVVIVEAAATVIRPE
jgi:hypothetical protein